jgi:hypothetical protein
VSWVILFLIPTNIVMADDRWPMAGSVLSHFQKSQTN